jgi:hypothetical protein
VSIEARIGWVRMNKHLMMYWCTRGIWSPQTYYECYTGQCRATHGVSAEAYAWKTALGRGRALPDSLIMSRTVATRGALLAHVFHLVRLYPYKFDY